MDIAAMTLAFREERQNLISQERTYMSALPVDREWSAEEEETLGRMSKRIAWLDAKIPELDSKLRTEQENDNLRAAQATVFGETKQQARSWEDPYAELRTYIRTRGAQGSNAEWDGRPVFEIDIRRAARERELIRSGASPEEIRALAWDTGSIGSAVPTTMARTLYQYMEASIALLRMPTTKITTSTGENIDFPKLTAHFIGTQIKAQGTALAGTDPTFDKVTFGAYKYGGTIALPNETLTDTAFDIGSFAGQNIGRSLGRLVDADLAVGTGTGEPNGYITAGSVRVTTGGSTILPTVEKLIDLQHSIVDEYRQDPSCCWLMNDSTAGTLRKLRDGGGGTVGAFLWQPSLTNGIQGGQPSLLLDFPVYCDPNVSAAGSANKTIAFGAANSYYVRQVGNPVIDASEHIAFLTDMTVVRGRWRVDGDSLDINAVSVLQQAV